MNIGKVVRWEMRGGCLTYQFANRDDYLRVLAGYHQRWP